jgi:hypothetical protein
MLTKDQVIEKVKKLMRLGENDGATEAERDRAMAQAHKFLAKYNLDLAAVSGDDGKDDRTDEIIQFANNPAARSIAFHISELYFVKYMYFRGTNRHLFIGTSVNVAAAIDITKWLLKNIDKEARRSLRADPVAWHNTVESTYITSFRHGAADAIAMKVQEIIEASREQKSEAVPGTSLVLADVYQREQDENDRFAQEKYGASRKAKARSRKVDFGAYTSGVQHGQSVNLQKQVH